MAKIRISWPGGAVTATLEPTPTAEKVLAALPARSSANLWGDEVYFSLPLRATLEADARQVVDPGAVCFWVEGNSLALPFGPTPVSRGGECRLVTKVNVLGKLDDDPKLLGSVEEGDEITVVRIA
jgi:hypothetical protein